MVAEQGVGLVLLRSTMQLFCSLTLEDVPETSATPKLHMGPSGVPNIVYTVPTLRGEWFQVPDPGFNSDCLHHPQCTIKILCCAGVGAPALK